MFNTIQGCIRYREVACAERFYPGLDPGSSIVTSSASTYSKFCSFSNVTCLGLLPIPIVFYSSSISGFSIEFLASCFLRLPLIKVEFGIEECILDN